MFAVQNKFRVIVDNKIKSLGIDVILVKLRGIFNNSLKIRLN